MLSAPEAARWRAAPLSFDPGGREPGSLLGSAPTAPVGWHRLHHSRVLEPARWASAGRALLGWRLQLEAGLGVRTDAVPLVTGAVAVLRLGPLRAPVRVLAVRQEPDLVGFSYGTLPGHPESGEEAFWIERSAGRITAHVSALSRGGAWFTRAAGPLGRTAQHLAARRYLAVLAAQPPVTSEDPTR